MVQCRSFVVYYRFVSYYFSTRGDLKLDIVLDTALTSRCVLIFFKLCRWIDVSFTKKGLVPFSTIKLQCQRFNKLYNCISKLHVPHATFTFYTFLIIVFKVIQRLAMSMPSFRTISCFLVGLSDTIFSDST